VAVEWVDALQVFCADVGSIPNDHFAWARRHPDETDEEVHVPSSIESLTASVLFHLEREQPVALGFEMPMFLPVPKAPTSLGKARPTDKGSPAWSSLTGASVMATGIVQAAWALKAIYKRAPEVPVFTRWEPFAAKRSGLLIWEAFVTRDAKGDTHEEDAIIGVKAFCDQLPNPGDSEAKAIEQPLSLPVALCIWAGWSIPATELRRAGVVVRAKAS